MQYQKKPRSLGQVFYALVQTIIGAFLAAYSLEVFLIPNEIIDGGVIGIAILFGKLFGEQLIYPAVLLLNLPFLLLSYRYIGKTFLIQMFFSVLIFSSVAHSISGARDLFPAYQGDLLEIVVVGGLLLGLGVGLIIRSGGCLDGTEILGILINKKYGMTVGNVVLAANIIIFTVAGFVFGDWHPPIKSLITFFIVIKIMDMVIVGFDEMKYVMIFSKIPGSISQTLTRDLGLGLTILDGKGGYTREKKEVLYLIAERLQLAQIKVLVHEVDPKAIIAIGNLHEVASLESVDISKKNRNEPIQVS